MHPAGRPVVTRRSKGGAPLEVTLGFDDSERNRIAQLYWGAFGAKLGRVLGPEAKALHFIAAALSPDHAYCARDAGGRVLGVAGFKTVKGELVDGGLGDLARAYGIFGALWRTLALSLLSRDEENRRFLLDGLFVAEEARGLGVGSRLLDAIAREAATRGYAEVRLDVIDSNPRARALYERRGFVAMGDSHLGLFAPLFGFRSATTMVRRLR